MATKKAAAKTAKPAMASGIVIPPNSTTSMAEAVKQPDADTTAAPSSGALAATDPAILTDILRSSLSSDTPATGASTVLDAAASSAQTAPEKDQAPQPAAVGVDLAAGSDTSAHWRLDAAGNFEGVVNGTIRGPVLAPIHDLADARALPDVGRAVYVRASFDSPLAIRAFKDHDGRSMAVVWTGTTLAKAAITD